MTANLKRKFKNPQSEKLIIAFVAKQRAEAAKPHYYVEKAVITDNGNVLVDYFDENGPGNDFKTLQTSIELSELEVFAAENERFRFMPYGSQYDVTVAMYVEENTDEIVTEYLNRKGFCHA